jgi:hypothetical protein
MDPSEQAMAQSVHEYLDAEHQGPPPTPQQREERYQAFREYMKTPDYYTTRLSLNKSLRTRAFEIDRTRPAGVNPNTKKIPTPEENEKMEKHRHAQCLICHEYIQYNDNCNQCTNSNFHKIHVICPAFPDQSYKQCPLCKVPVKKCENVLDQKVQEPSTECTGSGCSVMGGRRRRSRKNRKTNRKKKTFRKRKTFRQRKQK